MLTGNMTTDWDGICGTCDGRGCPTCQPEPEPHHGNESSSAVVLRSALQDALEFIEYYSHAWNGVSAKHPNTIVANARAALNSPAPAASKGADHA